MSGVEHQIAIEVRDVVKRFGDHVAVNQVSFRVRQGEFISLLGPSGCGKTTLLRMLGGLEMPDQGTILLSGADVTRIPAYGRNTNMIFQQLALFPHMDVFKNIAYGLKMKGVSNGEIRKSVERVLELVQLPGFGTRKVSQLSGGQAQRIAIARALVNQPQVLLLDEPLSALDAQLRLDMQRELKRIQRESGTTFIFVTHDQEEALNVSDRIGVMRDGVMLQYGTPDEIYERPADRFVAKFIGDTNLLPACVLAHEGDLTIVETAGEAIAIHIGQDQQTLSLRDQGHISIRYEYVRIGSEAEGLRNQLTGVIRDVRYGGTTLRYTLELDGVSEFPQLTAHVPHFPGKPRFSPGETVTIGWDPQDAVFLSDQGEGGV
ncbi:ABC transporter ATP-binding protein [Paenibacillus kribbensis]|uniref:ABC transporter ATP-binding protein n=1 Tax=Paenibacillus kribbensis TaxID=172713 RepID=UPI0008391505|nr:ABC transporter ATP-binding protein [Paenibacillus kribbensis]